MKYCSRCGTELQDDAKFCTGCGTAVGGADRSDDYGFDEDGFKKERTKAEQPGESQKTMGIVIIVFMLLSILGNVFSGIGTTMTVASPLANPDTVASPVAMTVFATIAFIPLAWEIPMTVYAWKQVKSNRRFSTGFAVCTLLFCSLISGILMFFYKPNGESNY